MGKKIDRFVLSAAAAAAFYLFYQRAYGSRILSLPLALLSTIVLRKTFSILGGIIMRTGWLQKRKLRSCTGSTILSLAAMPAEEAQERISSLVKRCYGEDCSLALVQNHPSLSLSGQQLFEIWKQHRSKEKLAVCATCRIDEACRSLAGSLKGPKIALIDAAMLSQMISEHPQGFTFDRKKTAGLKLRLPHIVTLIFSRKNAPRCMLASIAMFGLYLLGANIAYLASSMALMFVALVSLRQHRRPERLF